MSTQERHERFKAKGWTLLFNIREQDRVMLEAWIDAAGLIHKWAPGKEEPEQKAEPVSDGPEYRVLAGVTFPWDDKAAAQKIIQPLLTWDEEYIVLVIESATLAVQVGYLTNEAGVIPFLDRLENVRGYRIIVAGPLSGQFSEYLHKRHERDGCGYWPVRIRPKGRFYYNTSDLLDKMTDSDPRAVLPLSYYEVCRAAVRREAITTAFDSCYERVREIVDGEAHPERLHIIAETPKFVIFGEPGRGDKLEREYGVRP